jgi:hypothetical protein
VWRVVVDDFTTQALGAELEAGHAPPPVPGQKKTIWLDPPPISTYHHRCSVAAPPVTPMNASSTLLPLIEDCVAGCPFRARQDQPPRGPLAARRNGSRANKCDLLGTSRQGDIRYSRSRSISPRCDFLRYRPFGVDEVAQAELLADVNQRLKRPSSTFATRRWTLLLPTSTAPRSLPGRSLGRPCLPVDEEVAEPIANLLDIVDAAERRATARQLVRFLGTRRKRTGLCIERSTVKSSSPCVIGVRRSFSECWIRVACPSCRRRSAGCAAGRARGRPTGWRRIRTCRNSGPANVARKHLGGQVVDRSGS